MICGSIDRLMQRHVGLHLDDGHRCRYAGGGFVWNERKPGCAVYGECNDVLTSLEAQKPHGRPRICILRYVRALDSYRRCTMLEGPTCVSPIPLRLPVTLAHT